MPTLITTYVGGTQPTLGANERWFAALQDAIASANLGTDITAATGTDQCHRILLRKQKFSSATTFGTITTKCDATHWIEITTDVGASFLDDANVLTNPLRVDSTKGATIEYTGGNAAITISTSYARVSKLQFTTGDGAATGLAFSIGGTGHAYNDVDRCIFEGNSSNSSGVLNISAGGNGSVVRNSVVIQKRAVNTAFIASIGNASRAYNCVFVSLGTRLAAGVKVAYNFTTLRNCYVGGVDTPFTGTLSANQSNSITTCYTDATTVVEPGWNTQAMDATVFKSITVGTHDLRLADNSPLINKGTAGNPLVNSVPVDMSTDIYGNARDESYDIGPAEVQAALAAPVFTQHPSNVQTGVGTSATFSVTITGNPTPTRQWEVSTDGTNWTAIPGATGLSYQIASVSQSDSGKQFRCVATNSQGTVTSNVASLTVQIVPVTITQQPAASQSVSYGSSASFTVQATGTAPLTYQWYVSSDGTNWNAISGATANTYTIASVVMTDGGKQYRCIVDNAAASPQTSQASALTVNTVSPTVNTVDSRNVVAGAQATFSASGTGVATWQWQYQPSGSSNWTDIPGATSSSYTTDATTVTGGTANNGDKYRVRATHVSGGTAVSNTATLTVEASATAPVVTQHPVGQAVWAGSRATFTAAFSGTSPTFQWEVSTDGTSWTAIPDATGLSYQTPVTVAGDNGKQYRCKATNTVDTAYTNAATLTVNVPVSLPKITTPAVKNNTGSVLANVSGWTVNVYDAVSGELVVKVPDLVTDASGVLVVAHSLLAFGNTYTYEPVHAAHGRRLPTGTAS